MSIKLGLVVFLYLFGAMSFFLGLHCVWHACQNLGDLTVLPNFFVGLVLLVISAIVYAPLISDKLSWAFCNFLFSVPKAEQKVSLSKAQALIMQRDYEGAIHELEEKIEAHPDEKKLLNLLFQVKYEKCEQSHEVLSAIREEVLTHSWDAEYEKMALIAVDIYLENMDVDGSQNFLKLVLQQCDDEAASTRLALRLHSFQDFMKVQD